MRLGSDASIQSVGYGERLTLGSLTTVSLHPAGHILGSAQVRIERGGEVWVVTGDYKTAPDATCLPFEPLRCHTLITESTFGLPIYRWQESSAIFAQINAWWRCNAADGSARSCTLIRWARRSAFSPGSIPQSVRFIVTVPSNG